MTGECFMQEARRAFGVVEPDHGPAEYGVTHLEYIADPDEPEFAVCAACAMSFRTGIYRVRTLLPAAVGVRPTPEEEER